jgi:hypothetical protein
LLLQTWYKIQIRILNSLSNGSSSKILSVFFIFFQFRITSFISQACFMAHNIWFLNWNDSFNSQMYFMIRFVNCCGSNFNKDSKSKSQWSKNRLRQYYNFVSLNLNFIESLKLVQVSSNICIIFTKDRGY